MNSLEELEVRGALTYARQLRNRAWRRWLCERLEESRVWYHGLRSEVIGGDEFGDGSLVRISVERRRLEVLGLASRPAMCEAKLKIVEVGRHDGLVDNSSFLASQ